MKFLSKFNTEQKSWIMYDWANSVYSVVITTAVLPIYYKSVSEAVLSDAQSTLYWSLVNTTASFIVALLGPILGSIADFNGMKKRLFTFFVLLGVAFTFVLALVPNDSWLGIIIVYFFTVIGFTGANIFYDSFITDVASKDDMDKVSANGFAYGYIGSVIPFVICIALIMFSEQIGLTATSATKIAFVITALWWGLFTIPMWKNVKQKYGKPREGREIQSAFSSIFKTMKKIVKNRALLLFLIAYFFYIDGVNTIIKLATIIGTDVGIDGNTLLIVLLITQLVAFPSTIFFGYLSKKYKNSSLILATLVIYTTVGIYAMFFLNTSFDFFLMGVLIGTSQGAIQSLSRSYYAKMIPKENSNEFFGFYNIVGKFSTVIGPSLYGFVFYYSESIALAVGSIVMLFIIGMALFIRANKLKEL